MQFLQLLLLLPVTLTLATSTTKPPKGAVVVNVNSNSDGVFRSVQDAVWSLPNDTSSQTIFIYPGTYKGQVILRRPGPTVFQGYTKDVHSQKDNTVLLTNGVVASVAGSNAKSATLQIYTNDTIVYNIDVENTYGTGGVAGAQAQALALCQAGERNGYYSSGFYSFQDTVYTQDGTAFFGNVFIKGAVDYIFGMRGTAYFQNAILASTRSGYITAQGREDPSFPGAYVFDNATLLTIENATDHSMFLGRPWRNFSAVVFKNSDFGNVVDLRGWTQWGNTDPRTNGVYYAEFNNKGASAWNSARANFSQLITEEEAEENWSVGKTLGSNKWVDKRFLCN
ncbi:hypothetical protein Q9L58_002336 [Maublancomyces gigas]|uniref:Pectinesterase n=1 Tax=Discina gigas TaxID=1032678 RepID=A0ABR3GRU9_9PEZI